MEYDDTYDAVRNALSDEKEKEGGKPHAISLKPFRATRQLAMDEEQEALVVGLHWDSESNSYHFICVVDDGAGGIYATTDDELKGAVPAA